MTADAESGWARKAREGDERAFEALVGSYQGVLYNLAYRMTGNAEDARDLTQTVFLKAYRSLASFDPTRKFYSWIYRIMLNEAINFVQRRRPAGELSEHLASRDPAPEDEVHRSEIGHHVQEAMMELSLEYRQVLALRHLQDLSYAEISEILSLPEKTVKSRLFTARQLLGERLRRRGLSKP